MNPPLPTQLSLSERLRRIEHVALDMDGTIYSGGTLFPFTNAFLATASELGIGHSFLTNNSSKSTADYVTHLARLGITATAEQIFTSTQATIAHLREQLPALRRLFVLGTASMRAELAGAGFTLTAESADDEPDAVVLGFDTELVYPRLCRAAWWVKQGKPYLASHPDRICPTDAPTVLVDCGAIIAALKAATGREPDAVLGKPDPRMLRGLLLRHELRPEQLAMVGDRLYTDMVMARRAGALGVLVLTGEATAAEAAAARPAPDLVVANLAEFGERLRAARAGHEL
jgi:HAD superfamily hydrolase (TIGR01450 family)